MEMELHQPCVAELLSDLHIDGLAFAGLNRVEVDVEAGKVFVNVSFTFALGDVVNNVAQADETAQTVCTICGGPI